MNLGLDTLSVRQISRDSKKLDSILSNLHLIRFLNGILAIIIPIFLIYFITDDVLMRKGIIIYLFINIIYSFNNSFFSIFRAIQKIYFESLILIIESIIKFSLTMVFIYLNFSLISVIVAEGIAVLISFIFCFFIVYFLLNIKFLRPTIRQSVNLYLKSFPFSHTRLINYILFNINLLLLFWFKGSIISGFYGVSLKIIVYSMNFSSVFIISIFPVMSKISKKYINKYLNLYKSSFILLVMYGSIITIFLFLFSKWIILYAFGKDYVDSILILKLLSLASFFIIANLINKAFLDSINSPIINLYIGLIGIIINILLGILLIPLMSYFGAVVSLMISLIFIFIASRICIKLKIKNLNN